MWVFSFSFFVCSVVFLLSFSFDVYLFFLFFFNLFLMEAFPLLGPYPFIPLPSPFSCPSLVLSFPLPFFKFSIVMFHGSLLSFFQVLNLVSILPFPSCVVGAHKVHDLANPSSTFIVGVGPFLSKTSPFFVMGPYSWVKAMAI